MKVNTRRALLFASVATVLVLAILFAGIFSAREAASAADEDAGYYYSGLRDNALGKKFYGVFQDMAKKGLFKTGTAIYDLTDVLTETEIREYVEAQSPKIPVSFGAARDTFYYDNPDLFYVDFYKLELTAGTQDGKYVAFVSSGRADSFLDGDFPTTDAVTAAIAEYETALNKVVSDAKNACGDDVVKLIKYVNNALLDTVDYDYGARENSQSGKPYDNYVNTAYGALVKGKAMCGGYSSAFKAVMDRLNIPCVLILGNGYTKTQGATEAGFEAHMWNAVQVDGLWYGVDVTWNDDTGAPEKYLLAGNDLMSKEHYVDPVVSTSGYEMNYPVLRPFGYGVSEDASGFKFKDSGYLLKDETAPDTEDNRQYMGYSVDATDESGRSIFDIGVQYQGKDHKKLAEEGKYLCVRYIYEEGTESEPYSGWINMKVYDDVFGYEESPMYPIYQNYSYIYFNWSVYEFQFAIIDLEPTEENMLNNIFYKRDVADNILAMSVVYGNDAYGTFNPAPTITPETTPAITRATTPVTTRATIPTSRKTTPNPRKVKAIKRTSRV